MARLWICSNLSACNLERYDYNFDSFFGSLSNEPEIKIFFSSPNFSTHHIIALQPMHFFPMAMYTHKLVPPPKEVSTELGETRSAKRGAVSIDILDETDGLGGLKDKYVYY